MTARVRPITAGRAAPVSADPQQLSDVGNAHAFAERHGRSVRYDHRRGQWLLWTPPIWQPDGTGAVVQLAVETMRARLRDAADLPDANARLAAFRWCSGSLSRARLDSLLALARTVRPIADDGTAWDRNPLLLAVENGVVDLRDGTLRPGRPEDRLTLSTHLPYDPEARSPLWDRVLRDVLIDPALVDFVQLAAGYSASGDTRRDCWFLLHGDGRNGKGTLVQPIRRALGDYAMELPASVFDRRVTGSPFDLAALPGKRFVTSSESGDTILMNHDRIKQLSGGDVMRVAAKYEHGFEFQPTSHLWLSANRRPRVTDDSPAFWARVLPIPFTVSFVGREDRHLRPALEHDPAHQAAVLAWVVAGAVRYAQQGLTPPAAVQDAARDYRCESDPLIDFLDACTEPDPHAQLPAADLYAAFAAWLRSQGVTERDPAWLSPTAFGRRASDRLPWQKTRTGKVYFGLARRPL